MYQAYFLQMKHKCHKNQVNILTALGKLKLLFEERKTSHPPLSILKLIKIIQESISLQTKIFSLYSISDKMLYNYSDKLIDVM